MKLQLTFNAYKHFAIKRYLLYKTMLKRAYYLDTKNQNYGLCHLYAEAYRRRESIYVVVYKKQILIELKNAIDKHPEFGSYNNPWWFNYQLTDKETNQIRVDVLETAIEEVVKKSLFLTILKKLRII